MWRSVSVLSAGLLLVGLGGQARLLAGPGRTAEPAKTLAILVDTSQAIEPHLHDVRTALGRFVREMQTTHQISLIEFGERPAVLTDYTNDPVRLQQGVQRVFSRSGTGAYTLEAIIETSKKLRLREGTNPAIVVITAEGPEFSDRDYRTVVDELKTSGATLHALVLTSRNQSFRDEGAREREFALAEGAEKTGGTREHLLSSLALEPRLHELTARLK